MKLKVKKICGKYYPQVKICIFYYHKNWTEKNNINENK